MSSPPGKLAATLGLVLGIAGCCVSGGGGVELQTEPLVLPQASFATAVPASWFVTATAGVEFTPGALDDCVYGGNIRRLTTTLALVEVTATRIALAGEPVAELDGGHPRGGERGDFLIEPLFDALLALHDQAVDLAEAGCRPWAAGEPLMVDDRDLDKAPPLLLAMDRGVPGETLARVMYTAGQAGFTELLVWVSDADPAAVVAEQVSEDALLKSRRSNPLPLAAGTMERTIEALDQRFGEGDPCSVLTVPAAELGTEPALLSDSAAAQTLSSADTVAVLPLRMPRIAAATLDPDPVIPTEMLITGQICPQPVIEVLVKMPVLDPGLFEGIEIEGGVGIFEALELSPVLDDGVELSATPTP